jgi:nitronate monooxygenase
MFADSPIVLAPMAGGVGTPDLVAAVSEAGAFAYLPAGYLTVDALAEQLTATAAKTGKLFGVNLFAPGQRTDHGLKAYAARIGVDAVRYAVELGEPTFDDDHYAAKLELLIAQRAPVVSFTFGLPTSADVDRLHAAGSHVSVTVTTVAEATAAARIGADSLCLQGIEAGGHRGGFSPDEQEQFGLLSLISQVSEAVQLPVTAAGGIMRAPDVAGVLAAGASAAQCGTAFLLCPEAGTNEPHRAALAERRRPTALTRAFTGRPARGLVNLFLNEHSAHAPSAYPQVHHMTKPLRAAATKAGDPEAMSLWAGQGYRLARNESAADVVARLTP